MDENVNNFSLMEKFILLRRWWWFPVIFWTGLVAWSLVQNIDVIQSANTKIARNSAQNIFRMVQLTRLWNARHGGVYVPITPNTQPNPYLKVPNRDLLTTDGMQLTLINPAFMTRQLTELIEHDSRVSFNITSLKPLRPENKADPWETSSLKLFERDVDEVYERIVDGERDVFRYMAPLLVKKPCLKCHADQGNELGDIRGGISVTLQSEYLFANEEQRIISEVIKHSAVYLLVTSILLLFFGKMRSQWLQLRHIEHSQETVIQERTQELELLAMKDALTGLFNRKALDDYLESEFNRARRYRHDLSVFMIDIDHFKEINDRYNHQTGDRVLKAVAKLMLRGIRSTDFAARYGGEEFFILLPETPLGQAGDLAERLRKNIAGRKIQTGDSEPAEITVSIGVAVYPDQAKSAEELVKVADEALYQAKRQGRNRVVLADSLPRGG